MPVVYALVAAAAVVLIALSPRLARCLAARWRERGRRRDYIELTNARFNLWKGPR